MKNIESRIINNKRTFAFRSKELFLEFIKNKKKILIALNAEKLNKNNPELEKIINDNIGYPDGIGAVWALKRKGLRSAKIPGAELWIAIINRYYKYKSFYLIGGKQNVIDETVLKLRKTYPGIDIKNFRNGYLKKEDKNIIKNDLKIKKPDIVFVAMGSPRQEFIMDYFSKDYSALYMGLGGSFDVYTGHKKRAPKLFVILGLEWLYRLLREPRRWRRQLRYFSFTLKVIINRI